MCGLASDSLAITGSGADGDPWQIESNAFIICTSVTRPSPPEMWQHIFETDTLRQRFWDGTNWVITAGNMPNVHLERQSALSVVTAIATDVPLTTEILDGDGFHAGTNAFVTVPAGLGGDYLIMAYGTYDLSATGYRDIFTVVGNNAPAPSQISTVHMGGYAIANTSLNGFPQARPHRLAAGATVTLRTQHTNGANLDLLFAVLALRMVRHVPSLA